LLYTLFAVVNTCSYLLRIAGPTLAIGAEYSHSSIAVNTLSHILLTLFLPLLMTSIFDTAFPGDEMSRQRCFVSVLLWILASVIILSLFAPVITGGGVGFNIFTGGMYFLITVIILSLMIVAHRKMLQVVSHYSTSAAKPPLVVKVDELCDAICRYYYPLQIPAVISIFQKPRQGRPSYQCLCQLAQSVKGPWLHVLPS